MASVIRRFPKLDHRERRLLSRVQLSRLYESALWAPAFFSTRRFLTPHRGRRRRRRRLFWKIQTIFVGVGRARAKKRKELSIKAVFVRFCARVLLLINLYLVPNLGF